MSFGSESCCAYRCSTFSATERIRGGTAAAAGKGGGGAEIGAGADVAVERDLDCIFPLDSPDVVAVAVAAIGTEVTIADGTGAGFVLTTATGCAGNTDNGGSVGGAVEARCAPARESIGGGGGAGADVAGG